MRTIPVSARDQNGFTLLETLVTLVILSVGILLFERSLAGSFGATSAANHRTDAVILALRKLDEAGSEVALAAGGETDGLAGRYHWTVRIEPIGSEGDVTPADAQEYLPYWVDVVVNWRDGRVGRPVSVHYRRLRLERRP